MAVWIVARRFGLLAGYGLVTRYDARPAGAFDAVIAVDLVDDVGEADALAALREGIHARDFDPVIKAQRRGTDARGVACEDCRDFVKRLTA